MVYSQVYQCHLLNRRTCDCIFSGYILLRPRVRTVSRNIIGVGRFRILGGGAKV